MVNRLAQIRVRRRCCSGRPVRDDRHGAREPVGRSHFRPLENVRRSRTVAIGLLGGPGRHRCADRHDRLERRRRPAALPPPSGPWRGAAQEPVPPSVPRSAPRPRDGRRARTAPAAAAPAARSHRRAHRSGRGPRPSGPRWRFRPAAGVPGRVVWSAGGSGSACGAASPGSSGSLARSAAGSPPGASGRRVEQERAQEIHQGLLVGQRRLGAQARRRQARGRPEPRARAASAAAAGCSGRCDAAPPGWCSARSRDRRSAPRRSGAAAGRCS